jgi:hypothetical protein
LLAVAVLAAASALSSAQNAFAAATISLTPSCGGPGTRVTFSGSGFDAAIERCAVQSGLISFGPHCGVTGPGTVSGYFTVRDGASGKYTVTVTGYIGEGTIAGEASAEYNTDCPAVGGVVEPANTFALLSPWLAVIGLAGCIGTVAVVARKRGS